MAFDGALYAAIAAFGDDASVFVSLMGMAVACGTPPMPVMDAAKVPDGAGCDVAKQ